MRLTTIDCEFSKGLSKGFFVVFMLFCWCLGLFYLRSAGSSRGYFIAINSLKIIKDLTLKNDSLKKGNGEWGTKKWRESLPGETRESLANNFLCQMLHLCFKIAGKHSGHSTSLFESTWFLRVFSQNILKWKAWKCCICYKHLKHTAKLSFCSLV